MKQPLPRSTAASGTTLGPLRRIPALLRLVWRASPALTAASVALRLARSVLPVAMLYVGKLIIDEIVLQAALPPPAGGVLDHLETGRLAPIALLLAAELGLAVLSDLLARASTLVDGLLGERYSNMTSVMLMQHAATLDLAQFEDSEEQDRLERARRQTSGRSTLLGQILQRGQDVLTALTLVVGLAAYAPWLVVLIAVALVPSLMGEIRFNAQGYRLSYVRAPERRKLDYLRILGASPEHAKELKLFGLAAFLVDRFRGFAQTIYEDNRRLAVRRAAWGGLFAGLATLAYYAAFAVIVWRTVSGEFSIGDLTFLSGSFLRLRSVLEGFLLGLSQIASQAQYLDDLFAFLETRPGMVAPTSGAVPVPRPLREGFVFEDVGFRYPGSDVWAVRHLDLVIGAGEAVALVGENGAGKTTIVKLLTRLYDPSEGRILLDGRDLRDYDLESLRDRIGVVFQDFARYHFSAAENVAAGRIEAADDRARIVEAARRSLADPILPRLPRGYAHPPGHRLQDGPRLSGGS
ncbi:MAG: ABC transporter ATP-binding protein [Salinarimonas sp.]